MQGPKGETGSIGGKGIQGNKGSPGNKGSTGVNGDQGIILFFKYLTVKIKKIVYHKLYNITRNTSNA